MGESAEDQVPAQQTPGCETVEGADGVNGLQSDQALRRTFHLKLTALMEAGKTEKPETLIEQLNRKKCSSVTLPEAGKAKKTTAEIYRDHKQSTVVFGYLFLCGKCDKLHMGCASGFVVSADGVIATSYHVVNGEGRQAFGIMTADGSIFPVKEVLAADEAQDMVLLRVDAEDLKATALSVDESVGADVTVIGHPNGHFYTLTRGIISRYTTRQKLGRTVLQMEITADFARGSSGGPVFNERGNIVGMVRSTSSIYYKRENGTNQNLQMVIKRCVPAKAILGMIESPDSEAPEAATKPES